MKAIIVSPHDDVAVALQDLAAGELVDVGGDTVRLVTAVPAGHKVALRDKPAGADVLKYGCPIGRATADIPRGAWVHTHNLATALASHLDYRYGGAAAPLPAPGPGRSTFAGFRRADGGVGVRNDLYIVPTVGCINGMVDRMARQFWQGDGPFDSVIVARHPYGCSQLGGDLRATQQILRGLIRHPNAGGVLVVGLGCENNQIDQLREAGFDDQRVKFLVAQEVDDEYAAAAALLDELREAASADVRVEVPVSALRVGLKCGGSDGFSGITANPLVGAFADELVARGGSAVLTEVPEMFGAEQLLMERARDERVFTQIVELINGFKDYFTRHGSPISENPSPGNKQGGITTLEEKSLGCTQKSGTSPVVDVVGYGQRLRRPGLSLLQAPGNDLVSSTALGCAGCQIVLFTTGRGTPFGTFVPTVKISSNTALARRKPSWIDFDAGVVLDEPREQVVSRFTDLVLDIASGQPTRNELGGMSGIAIWKDGVTE
ncbi:MAG: altronate dehydratase family protein [Propionibacteriaceae bacterium]|nr:altronate dehydratase family protein [Propionibacteriaceae bacterium]